MYRVNNIPETFEVQLNKARNNSQFANTYKSLDEYYNGIMGILASAKTNLSNTQYNTLIKRIKNDLV